MPTGADRPPPTTVGAAAAAARPPTSPPVPPPPLPIPPLLLEHVNLNVPDRTAARTFYVDVLGGAVNPVGTNEVQLHVNVGASQFHLLLKTPTDDDDGEEHDDEHDVDTDDDADDDADGGVTTTGRGRGKTTTTTTSTTTKMRPITVPQRWQGHIELWTIEPLSDIIDRLPSDRCRRYRDPTPNNPHDAILCVCPWGNRYVVRVAPPNYRVDGVVRPGGCGKLVAMHRLVHPILPGMARHVHSFWTNVLGCTAILDDDGGRGGDGLEVVAAAAAAGGNGGGGGGDGGGGGEDSDDLPRRTCTVRFETGQELVLEEVGSTTAPASTAQPVDAYDTDGGAYGYHLCLYLPTEGDFARAYRSVELRNLLYANPRFASGPPEFGNATTWEVARRCGQFRVKDWRGVGSEEEGGGTAASAAAAASTYISSGVVSDGGEEVGGEGAIDAGGGSLPPLGLVMELEVRSVRHPSCPLPPPPPNIAG